MSSFTKFGVDQLALSVSETTIEVINTPRLICAFNPSRVWLVIGATNTGPEFVISTTQNVNGNKGLCLNPVGTSYVAFNLNDHGPLVTSQWFAINNGGGSFGSVWEGFYVTEPMVDTARIEELNKQMEASCKMSRMTQARKAMLDARNWRLNRENNGQRSYR